MLLAQIGIAICLANLALSDPGESVVPVAMFALGVAFFAATQDIAIDAWRIESASADKQGAMAAAAAMRRNFRRGSFISIPSFQGTAVFGRSTRGVSIHLSTDRPFAITEL